jgi:hypothetical protein
MIFMLIIILEIGKLMDEERIEMKWCFSRTKNPFDQTESFKVQKKEIWEEVEKGWWQKRKWLRMREDYSETIKKESM